MAITLTPLAGAVSACAHGALPLAWPKMDNVGLGGEADQMCTNLDLINRTVSGQVAFRLGEEWLAPARAVKPRASDLV